LAYQETNADPRHIEAVEPCLDVESDFLSLLAMPPFENALRDGCHSGVMTPLDVLERLGETFVVVVNLWRPLDVRRSPCVIPTIFERPTTPTSVHQLLFHRKGRHHRPLFNWYPEPVSTGTVGVTITVTEAAVRALLKRQVWRRDGE